MRQHVVLFGLALLIACSQAAVPSQSCAQSRLAQLKSGNVALRGVNLGTWFIAEDWMKPQMWNDNGCDRNSVKGQWLLEKCLGSKASAVLEQHWSTFFTESDFADMSALGVNLIRMPVGWWQIYDPLGGVAQAPLNYTVSQRNYTVGALKYMDSAFQWAEKYGIGILIGMHAAPGSQNGQDHSSPEVYQQNQWASDYNNINQTLDSLERYAIRYASSPALWGVYLLNEPTQTSNDTTGAKIQQYFVDAYHRVRAKVDSSVAIVICAFNNPYQVGYEQSWVDFMNAPNFVNVWSDIHIYFCFGGAYDGSSQTDTLKFINNQVVGAIQQYKSVNSKPMLVGEWSGCNNFNNGSQGTAAIIRAQLSAYQGIRAWTFWSWTDGSLGNLWSLKTALRSDVGWMTTADMANNTCPSESLTASSTADTSSSSSSSAASGVTTSSSPSGTVSSSSSTNANSTASPVITSSAMTLGVSVLVMVLAVML